MAPGGRSLRSIDDVLRMLDEAFPTSNGRWTGNTDGAWWDGFYSDRERPVPFFAEKPDENLADYLGRGLVRPGRALDLGCGPGRNALFLATNGFSVDAIDLSAEAIAWARERASTRDLDVTFHQGDAFQDGGAVLTGPYDLIYDSGCLPHLPPHRRIGYLDLIDRLLAPGGHFGVACFASGLMGSESPDMELYREGSLGGGLGFTPDDLRWLFQDLKEVEIRPMRPQGENSPYFGPEFLLAGLFTR
ncbi:class I SAM-dependent methyltransferase [Kineosporia rhizophila]|nr:class I SAM-dependent methyltransferase [Kineosporia sp. NBRC 101677]MCE0539906.1 class I SAM-dependent methyltransferase [Kineosporia rhizophila]